MVGGVNGICEGPGLKLFEILRKLVSWDISIPYLSLVAVFTIYIGSSWELLGFLKCMYVMVKYQGYRRKIRHEQ